MLFGFLLFIAGLFYSISQPSEKFYRFIAGLAISVIGIALALHSL